ncbi:MAG: TonB-dependent receptor plug [Edaphobacter sp.]|nr:TonB-dependent receptor plug [Edaphobacter sp.]
MKYLCLRLLLLILCVTVFATAQSTDATISGLVVDTSGRVIPDADILILNEATGVQFANKTNGTGIYTVSVLPPGQYRVQVSKVGFKTLIKPGIILNVQSALALNFTLPLGAASESITVEAGSSPINTTNASVSTVIDRKFVENAPLNGRSFQDLISMTPGVVTQSPQARSSTTNRGDFGVNGQRTESNQYIVDGVSANNNPGNGNVGSGGSGTVASSTALGTTQSLISVDALQEFRVESSSYSAEYGGGPGGQFSFGTRSGTNHLHGSAFDYLRNNFFDANDWFNNYYGKPTSPLRQNDFGGTLGGPVTLPRLYNGRDRTFFFFSYEGLRLTQPKAATTQYVPNTALRQTAAIPLQPILNAFPLQNGKEELVPCTQGSSSTYPCPTGVASGSLVESGLADFIQSYSLPSRIDSTSLRGDHTFGPKLSLFFRFGDTPSSASGRTLSSFSQTHINTRTYTLGITSQLSSNRANEFRLGYSRNDGNLVTSLDRFGGAVPIDTATQVGAGGYPNAETLFYLTFAGVGTSSLSAYKSSTGTRNWNVLDTFSASVGHHYVKVGVDFKRRKELRNSATPLVQALYYSTRAVNGNAATALYVQQVVNPTPIFNNTAIFLQDQWQVNPRLGLSLGLRWELDPPPRDQHGADAFTLTGTVGDPSTLRLAPRGTPLWHTYWYNFAPRLGVAWLAHNTSGWETVLKTGGGVFFDTANQAAGLGFNSFGFIGLQSHANAPLPVTPADLSFSLSLSPPYTSAGIYAFPARMQMPYTLQWNASIEQSLGKSQTVSISYVGANGRRLLSTQSISLQALNPNFGTVYVFPGNITSNYQALQTKFQRTMGHGLQALGSYTWSHSIDYGSTYQAFGLTRGNSDFDVRNNLSGGLSWEIPSAGKSSLSKALFDGWAADARFTARTSFPITLYGNLLLDPSTGNYYYSGVNYDSSRPLYLYGRQYPGGRLINGGPKAVAPAFTTPAGMTGGNAPRNIVRGFGESQVNLAVRRDFHLKENASIQFRAESFNVFNHPNFGYVDYILTNATFGQATMMLNQSLGTVASQYQQGGPRSMQFALKLKF